jgi:arylformamidase
MELSMFFKIFKGFTGSMKHKIIDISVGLEKGMPVWPDSHGIDFKQSSSLSRGDLANVVSISMDVHTGTHIENSLHFIKDGDSVDKINFDLLIGKTSVVCLPDVKVITALDLEKLDLSKNTKRLLFKTSNSNFWKQKERKFQKDYVGFDTSAASWIIKSNIKLIGIDYLSVAKFDEAVKVHQILLKNKIIILETLDLSNVGPGVYQLICLPLKFLRTEAAPVRAVLIPL